MFLCCIVNFLTDRRSSESRIKQDTQDVMLNKKCVLGSIANFTATDIDSIINATKVVKIGALWQVPV